jgi:hypothetical protein
LQRVSYEKWKSQLDGDPNNVLARYSATFPDQLPEDAEHWVAPRLDCEETLRIVGAAGIDRPGITQQLLETYFSFIAEHSVKRDAVGAD